MSTTDTGPIAGLLTEAECQQLTKRLIQFTHGEGYTVVGIRSGWTGYLRWARNRTSGAGDVRNVLISLGRNINGAGSINVLINDTDDATLFAAVRRAERFLTLDIEQPENDLKHQLPPESVSPGARFSDATAKLDETQRTQVVRTLVQSTIQAGMLSAGYLEVSASCQAMLDSLGRTQYYAYTNAQYSVTVRDPQGTGSGWAGDASSDWATIDAAGLSAHALAKCLASRNPVTLEPGRYTTILEPQAVADFVGPMITVLDYIVNTGWSLGPFQKPVPPQHGLRLTKLGEKVVDTRVTISADPADPVGGFAPFDIGFASGREDFADRLGVFRPITWIDRGVLVKLGHTRVYGITELGVENSTNNSGAFRMSGGQTSIDEMIATTARGIVVTRFDQIQELDESSQLYRGYTRDGVWLIENGKISKPVKNFAFTESVLFALNNIEQLGVPQRVFRPPWNPLIPFPTPAIVPPLKVRDFSFTSLSDAV